MLRFVSFRVGQLLVTVLLASVVAFLVIQHAPGNPAQFQVGPEATPAEIAVEAHKLGLDAPLPERYWDWLQGAAKLNLGVSFATGLPVTKTIVTAFGNTARLAIMAILIGTLLGIPLGLLAAVRRGRWLDTLISTYSATALSIPSFALGTLLILVVAVRLKAMPAAGAGNPGQSFWESLRFALMPAVTLAIPFSAVLARYIRMELSEALGQPYVLTARALGLRRRTVLANGWRNALIPTITVMGIQIGRLLAGAVVTETVFSYPGIGYLTIQSIQNSDYPVIEGVLLIAAVVFLLVMFAVDLVVGVVDPRLRAGRA
ncbi:MAG: ABC transporter permease [Solirubrobacteraceae bacterium]